VKRQVAVMGLGRFGISVASTLYDMGNDVLALDADERNISDLPSRLTKVAQADATSEAVLRDLGIKDYDVAIVSMGSSIEASVLSTILVKKMGVPYVIARASNELHGSILERIGADIVIHPEREMGIRTAHNMTVRDASDYMPVAAKYGIAKVEALPFMVGRTLSELGCGPRGKYGVAVLMVKRKGEIIVTPELSDAIKEGDVLVLSGEDDRIERLLQDARKGE
jgi:trk system potassium uptake protein